MGIILPRTDCTLLRERSDLRLFHQYCDIRYVLNGRGLNELYVKRVLRDNGIEVHGSYIVADVEGSYGKVTVGEDSSAKAIIALKAHGVRVL